MYIRRPGTFIPGREILYLSGSGSRGRLRRKLIVFHIAFNLFCTIFLFVCLHVCLSRLLIRVALSYLVVHIYGSFQRVFVGSSFLLSSSLCQIAHMSFFYFLDIFWRNFETCKTISQVIILSID